MNSRFTYGRARQGDFNRNHVKHTWPNQGWTYSTGKKTNDYNDIYLKKNKENTMNKTCIVEKPRRALSNAKPADRLPKEMREKIEKNR